jgi:NAD+ synthase
MDIDGIHQKIISGIQNYFRDNNFKNAVLGVSGGLDSSVALKLAADALGPENVIAITMPETGLTASENMAHAKKLCEFLGVHCLNQPINNYMLNYATLPWKQGDMAYMNTKARVRATILYNFANTHNALVIGTSNKSELLLGYGTKHGDLAADIFPLGNLYKTDVYMLADFMEMPKEIIEKTPSAELYAGQTDEAELGGKYEELDVILKQYELGEDMLIEKGMNALLVRKVFMRMKANKHKLEKPFIVKISDEI